MSGTLRGAGESRRRTVLPCPSSQLALTYSNLWITETCTALPCVACVACVSQCALGLKLDAVHLYQHYSLFKQNKLQYTWRRDYCECVRPVQLPVLTEVRAPSLLEHHPRYVPHLDRAGYNTYSISRSSWKRPVSYALRRTYYIAWFQDSAAKYLRTAPFWVHQLHNDPEERTFYCILWIDINSLTPELFF